MPSVYRHSEETRKKISQSLMGRVVSEETRKKISKAMKGRKPWDTGKHLSEETRMKLRKASTGNKNHLGFRHVCSEETKNNISVALSGEKNPAWRGGVSFEPYGPEFNERLKERIRKRDGHMCMYPLCGTTKNLAIHHIDYDKKNNNSENLISLCNRHNTKVNSNRPKWTKYFQDLISSLRLRAVKW